jgi:hypothetical protein
MANFFERVLDRTEEEHRIGARRCAGRKCPTSLYTSCVTLSRRGSAREEWLTTSSRRCLGKAMSVGPARQAQHDERSSWQARPGRERALDKFLGVKGATTRWSKPSKKIPHWRLDIQTSWSGGILIGKSVYLFPSRTAIDPFVLSLHFN